MNTAQEHLDGMDKEAWVLGSLAKGGGSLVKSVKKFTVKPPKASIGTRIGNRYKTAKKWSNEQYGKYKKTDMGKKFGANPLYAAGGLAAGGIVI